MAKCFKCGAELSGTGKFCPECGTPQSRAKPSQEDQFSSIYCNGDFNKHFLNIKPGEKLFNSRFTIDSRIGSGGFGEVYLADDQDAQYPVALKIVPTVEGEEKIAAEQLQNEINLRRKITVFKHITRVNDIYVDPDYKGLPLVLLSMEYADGGSLRVWLRESIDSIKQEDRRSEALIFFKEACLGVKSVHDAGLVHLDLKPENMLLMDGQVKVSDLGLSRNYIQYAQNRETVLKAFGTPSYMSPEQFKSARQKDINHLSDIYTLGIILFELLDGHVPFDGAYDELREKHLSYKPPFLDGALAPWGKIVERCLKKDPSKRYQSVEELLSDLKRAEAGDVLSADVVCKECGKINKNVDLKRCEECGKDIGYLFRRCPRCKRLNRLDVEVCPEQADGCGFKVGQHFLVLGLLKEANSLRDVDPEQAIRCLVSVIKIEGGNKEAKEMLPGLRSIQEKIEKIIPGADSAQNEGRLEDARVKWQDVLSLAPRHRLATARKDELDELIKRYNKNYEKAFVLMDHGIFIQARELLDECREIIPTRKETDNAFTELNQREQKFNQCLENAKSEKRLKNLRSALKNLELCLEESSKSEEVLTIKSSVGTKLTKTAKYFDDAERLLTEAEFESVQKKVEDLCRIQSDFKDINLFIEKIVKDKEKYNIALTKCEMALRPEERDLVFAEKELKEALKVCSNSKEADTLLNDVRKKKKQAKKLIKDAMSSINAAKFYEAENRIKEAESIWPANRHAIMTHL